MKRSAFALFLLAMAIPSLACRHPASTQGGRLTAASKGGGPVVAEVEGTPITLAEVDLRAAGRLAQVGQDEYDARLAAAKAIVAERLQAAEAKRRNLSVAELLEAEVDAKMAPIGAKELSDTYDANSGRFVGRSREDALATIEKLLKDERRSALLAAYNRQLLGKAGVKIDLTPPRQDTGTLRGPSLGPPGAKVTLLEFTDYQCPYCRRAEQTVSTLLKQYETKVRFVHADFPLSFHDRALIAARASHCAGDQGKFFAYRHDLLMEPGDLSDKDLGKRALDLGLDAKTFSACIQSDRHDAAIHASEEQGERFGVNATPTFFVNGRKFTGSPTVEEFRRVLDEELAAAGG
jgi:protein-disulfide isomerase